VTVNGRNIYVGDLLKALSAKSGVALSAGVNDGAANERLSIRVTNRPLRDVLKALWSMVSYYSGEWQWDKTGNEREPKYVLRRPVAAQMLPVRIERMVRMAFVNQTESMIGFSHYAPDQRTRHVEELRKILELDDSSIAKAYVSDRRVWDALGIFERAVN